MSNLSISSITKGGLHQIILTVIPGAMVTIPLWVIVHDILSKRELIHVGAYTEYVGGFYSLTALLIIFAGLMIENLASGVERILDDICKVNYSAWYRYLFSSCGDKKLKVFHKYIDGVVFRYKFELALIPTMFILVIEFGFIWHLYELQWQYFIFFLVCMLAIFKIIYNDTIDACLALNELRTAYIHHCEQIKLYIPASKISKNKLKGCSNCKAIHCNRCQYCGSIQEKSERKSKNKKSEGSVYSILIFIRRVLGRILSIFIP